LAICVILFWLELYQTTNNYITNKTWCVIQNIQIADIKLICFLFTITSSICWKLSCLSIINKKQKKTKVNEIIINKKKKNHQKIEKLFTIFFAAERPMPFTTKFWSLLFSFPFVFSEKFIIASVSNNNRWELFNYNLSGKKRLLFNKCAPSHLPATLEQHNHFFFSNFNNNESFFCTVFGKRKMDFYLLIRQIYDVLCTRKWNENIMNIG
jgi:hypothetical protein